MCRTRSAARGGESKEKKFIRQVDTDSDSESESRKYEKGTSYIFSIAAVGLKSDKDNWIRVNIGGVWTLCTLSLVQTVTLLINERGKVSKEEKNNVNLTLSRKAFLSMERKQHRWTY